MCKMRSFHKVIWVFCLFLLVSLCACSSLQEALTVKQPAATNLNLIFDNIEYSFQSIRAVGLTPTGGADIGECLTALYQIKEGDDQGWYTAWYSIGKYTVAQADKFMQSGDRISAQECWFRASQYYRSAEFFLHGNLSDPRINQVYRLSRDCFIKGVELSDGLIEEVRIPYENTTLPGYLCRVKLDSQVRPLLIIHTGFDGTAEEIYFSSAIPALKRGFNVLLFDGPGQGRVIHEQGLHFRYDWEKVVTPVIDFVLNYKEVDSKRIALYGISLGGYLAPRAAAYEHRLSALIANGGVYDFYANMLRDNPDADKSLDDPNMCRILDWLTYEQMKSDPGMRWGINEGMYKFGAKTPCEFMKMARPYNLRDCAGLIACPTLIVDSEMDHDFPGQARQLYEALKCPKELMAFTSQNGAQEHCQMGAVMYSNEIIYNWLMKTFGMLSNK